MIRDQLKYLGYAFLIGIFIGCAATKAPEQMEERFNIQATIPVKVKAYRIPQGIFRGVLYPTSDEKAFDIWTIQDGKECHHKIPVDFEISGTATEVTNDWAVNANAGSDNVEMHFTDQTEKRQVKIQLPVKERQYSSSVVRYENKEVILIMDIAESTIDSSGLFVYILLGNDDSNRNILIFPITKSHSPNTSSLFFSSLQKARISVSRDTFSQ